MSFRTNLRTHTLLVCARLPTNGYYNHFSGDEISIVVYVLDTYLPIKKKKMKTTPEKKKKSIKQTRHNIIRFTK